MHWQSLCFSVTCSPGHPHLLGCKQLALVLADHCVAPWHLAVLVPRHRHQEVTWIGQAIGSWKE